MPSPRGRHKSKWVPAVAKAVGYNPQRIRNLLNKAGCTAPYEGKEAKGLKILEEAGLSLVKYREQAFAAVTAQKKNGNGKGNDPAAPPPPVAVTPSLTETGAKISATARKRLIPRLAAMLPEGPSPYGRTKARDILKAGGYKGPRWEDEARSVKIFIERGIPMEKFQYLTPDGEPVPVLTPEEERAQLKVECERLQKLCTELTENKDLARGMLESYEHHLIEALVSRRIKTMFEPLEMPISALNVLRTPKK